MRKTLNPFIHSFIFLFFFSSFYGQKNKTINFVLKKEDSDNYCTLFIINKTKKKIFLPILKSLSVNESLICGYSKNNYLFIGMNYFSNTNGEIPWITRDCFDEHDTIKDAKISTLCKKFSENVYNSKPENFILLNPKQVKKIKIPIMDEIEIINGCNWKLNKNVKDQLYLSIFFSGLNENEIYNLIDSTTIDKIKKLGYQLYSKKIVSNKVPIKIIE